MPSNELVAGRLDGAPLGSDPIAPGDPPAPPKRGAGARQPAVGRHRAARRIGLVASSVAMLLALWWIGSGFFEDYILPPPQDAWSAFRSALDRGVWTSAMWATLQHAAFGFALTLVVGLPLGILIGRSWAVEDFARVPLIFLQTIPTIVLIALALIFVGTNATGVVAVTVASGLPYFMLNVIQGTKAIDRELMEMGRAYGANERSMVRSIILPSVVPYFLAGARVTLGVVWQVTLFGEYLMGTNGVGFQVSTSIKLLDTASVFSWGLSIVALTIAFEYGVFRPMEARLTRHTRA